MKWQVYMILCSDASLYTGITTDVKRRFNEHATGRGAKYFRGRRPERLVYLEREHDRSSASKRECYLKSLTRREKDRMIAAPENVAGTVLCSPIPPIT
ncbi:GIY-YIG nuclease family protein [Geomonas sp. Red32]|uniref:GIY-YIG nuclease family protein n=1 Tax=Geomonas sp. Red32 TaxID=2912856 RepID=UPI00202CC302|nr:GIY-YIG nuclease family protein [Geomonas sp. Red32]MCM0080793.1 GIY-YIG nuclease family protein [Geomonas sp. Red32]